MHITDICMLYQIFCIHQMNEMRVFVAFRILNTNKDIILIYEILNACEESLDCTIL